MHGSPAELAELFRTPRTPRLAKDKHPRRTVRMMDMPAAVTACSVAMSLCHLAWTRFSDTVEGLRDIAKVVDSVSEQTSHIAFENARRHNPKAITQKML